MVLSSEVRTGVSREPHIYEIDEPKGLSGGDYGGVLQSGIIMGLAADGTPIYGRTGPYVPSIAFPDVLNMVVTEAFESAFAESGLSGASFAPIAIGRIVYVDWRNWGRDDWKYPSELGFGNDDEPGDYVRHGVDSPDLRNQVGRLWRMSFVELSSWNPKFNVFRLKRYMMKFVDDKAKAWLERHCPGEFSLSAPGVQVT